MSSQSRRACTSTTDQCVDGNRELPSYWICSHQLARANRSNYLVTSERSIPLKFITLIQLSCQVVTNSGYYNRFYNRFYNRCLQTPSAMVNVAPEKRAHRLIRIMDDQTRIRWIFTGAQQIRNNFATFFLLNFLNRQDSPVIKRGCEKRFLAFLRQSGHHIAITLVRVSPLCSLSLSSREREREERSSLKRYSEFIVTTKVYKKVYYCKCTSSSWPYVAQRSPGRR